MPAIALVNALRATCGVQAGQFITTGTYVEMYYAKPGDHVSVSFVDFGDADIRLAASSASD